VFNGRRYKHYAAKHRIFSGASKDVKPEANVENNKYSICSRLTNRMQDKITT